MMIDDLPAEPEVDCDHCPRLVSFRDQHKQEHPDWHNGPVRSFGPQDATLLIVGLAPGLRGANATGRPFTGDGAGDTLYPILIDLGIAQGSYKAHQDDGLSMSSTRITNAIRCVPPQNKPTSDEARRCRVFLRSEIKHMKNLRVIVALGRIAHDNVIRALDKPLSAAPFAHGKIHHVDQYFVHDSYHCSRYNMNTNRLTASMFSDVLRAAQLNAIRSSQ